MEAEDRAKSICGIDCMACGFSGDCKGCVQTDGRPFGAECIAAVYCKKGGNALSELKEKVIAAFNELHIQDMEEVKALHYLKGSLVNLAYVLPSGESVKFWDDRKIYLGNQLHKEGSGRCYGIVADEKYLMVSEYGDNGSDAEIVIFKRWN